MKSLFCICFTLFFSFSSIHAQSNLKLNIKNAETKEPLTGASVKIIALNKTAIADSSGSLLFKQILEGTYSIVISYVGFDKKEITISIPQTLDTIYEVLLEEIEEIKKKGVDVNENNLIISDTATLILPFHKEMDEIREDSAKSKSGTTRRGIFGGL